MAESNSEKSQESETILERSALDETKQDVPQVMPESLSAPTPTRQPSEAFPVIPKALQQQRRGKDALHRPYRSSPLSGKSSPPQQSQLQQVSNSRKQTSHIRTLGKDDEDDDEGELSMNSSNDGEEEKVRDENNNDATTEDSTAIFETTSTGARATPIAGIYSNSSSSDEAKAKSSQVDALLNNNGFNKNNSADGNPRDEIAQLNATMDAKMASLIAVEKRLLDTEKNAKRLLGVLRSKFNEEIPSKRETMKNLQKQLYTLMGEMDVIAARSVQFRDQEVDRQTTSLVTAYMEEAETLMLSIERTIDEMQAKEKSSRKAIMKTLMVSAIAVVIAFVSLIVTVLVIVPIKTPSTTSGDSCSSPSMSEEDAEMEEKWMWLVK